MKTDVIIVGAGPVGLLLANLLGQQKIDTLIIERKSTIDSSSRAIGITPPSLALLDRLGLSGAFIEKGVKVQGAVVHGKKHRLGSMSFRNIPHDFQFILSIPQRYTETLLMKNLEQFSSVRVIKNYQVHTFECEENACRVEAFAVSELAGKESETEKLSITGLYLCVCNGFRSTLREIAAIPWKGRRSRDTFLMADYHDNTELGSDAHLFFTPQGSVESFPLPGKKRRWVIQTDAYLKDPPEDYLAWHVERRSGYVLPSEDKLSQSSFSVYTYFMQSFHSQRMLFLGDCAHTISPIGGQGMNSGLADADLAASILTQFLRQGYSAQLLPIYTRCRRRAAKSAARRALLSMKTGTIRGPFLSAFRNGILKLLLNTAVSKELPKHYAMLSIPFKDVQSVKKRYPSILQNEGVIFQEPQER